MRRNKTPLYHQIFLILKNKIGNGEFPAGSYLPSERDLSADFGVSRITTMRAMNELAEAQLVTREQGKGTRVRLVGRGLVTRGPASSPNDGGGDIGVSLFHFSEGAAPLAAAAALGLASGDQVQCAMRVLRFAGRPFSQITTFVPLDIGRHWSGSDLERRPLQELLAAAGFRVERVEERVTAALADIEESERLKTETGTALIKITRISYSAHGRGLEYMIGLFRPDLYQYSVSLNGEREVRRARERNRHL